jgi:hypothetical protein
MSNPLRTNPNRRPASWRYGAGKLSKLDSLQQTMRLYVANTGRNSRRFRRL